VLFHLEQFVRVYSLQNNSIVSQSVEIERDKNFIRSLTTH
jgi:hypothetical protein